MQRIRDVVPGVQKGNSSPLPGSKKFYVCGPNGIRVPMREIVLHSAAVLQGQTEAVPPVRVYDTSGPYTDPPTTLFAPATAGQM